MFFGVFVVRRARLWTGVTGLCVCVRSVVVMVVVAVVVAAVWRGDGAEPSSTEHSRTHATLRAPCAAEVMAPLAFGVWLEGDGEGQWRPGKGVCSTDR